MATWVVLLRGVNVSGANRVPMAAFRDLMQGLGLAGVETYIQSGNAVFDNDGAAPEIEARIAQAMGPAFGFAPEVFVLSGAEIAAAAADHPFVGAAGNRVHVFFRRDRPVVDAAALRALALPGDGWHIGARWLVLHTPGGFGSSTLAERLPRLLPGPMTARNLRTVTALAGIAAARRDFA